MCLYCLRVMVLVGVTSGYWLAEFLAIYVECESAGLAIHCYVFVA